MEIDIAIDLGGHTALARPRIFAHRPAPVQVTWLGYAGTTGASFIDYMIADRVVAPFEHQPFFSERLVHLPDTFFPAERPALGTAPSRAEAGLPENAVVFCAFSNHWKITRTVFDIWMRLLAQIPGSVLWLKRPPAEAKAHLEREAASIRRGWSMPKMRRWTFIWRATPWPTCSSTPCPTIPTPRRRTRWGPDCRCSPARAAPLPRASQAVCWRRWACPSWDVKTCKTTKSWRWNWGAIRPG
jgi:hypothetical protein